MSQASKYDDHRRPLQRALRYAMVATAIIAVISAAFWGGLRELPGLWGVLIGVGIGFGFAIVTVISVLATANTNSTTTGAVVLGSWLLKIVVLIIVLAVLKDMEFYDRLALFVTVAAVTVAMMASEVWAIVTTNVTYVNPTDS
ncbi:MAG: hypothetical protein Q3976_01235 [Corynebacterium sp.]|nr:hypothetical protein [Corynebacterium sp.]